MPQELPAVACSLLKESGEIPLLELMQAAKEVSSKALESRWYSREDCPSTMPAGANLQAAYPELRHIQLDTPEGLIAGLGYALTRTGHTFQFHQANTAEERSGRGAPVEYYAPNERKSRPRGVRAPDAVAPAGGGEAGVC